MKTETVCGKKKMGGKEKTCLTSPEGRVVATKFKKNTKKQERKYARRETHKDVTKISEYQKLKTKKRQKQQQTERKALVQKDFLICPGSVYYFILRHAKHFPFHSGFLFFPFFFSIFS